MENFSVLMSVYYKEKPEFLRMAIDSIINQTLNPSQIVIVKDGKLGESLDNVIDEYKIKYPNLFYIVELEENVGLGRALKIGLEYCHYDIVARMDTDDICNPQRFELQMKFLDENKEIDVVGSNIDEFEENITNIISVRKVPEKYEDIIKFIKRRNPLNHMTVMYRKKAVIDSGSYIDFRLNEDYYLWIRMIAKGYRIENIQQSLVYARAGSEMFARRGGLEYAFKDIELQMKMLKLKLINPLDFIVNSLIRVITRLLPNNLRKILYRKVLRN